MYFYPPASLTIQGQDLGIDFHRILWNQKLLQKCHLKWYLYFFGHHCISEQVSVSRNLRVKYCWCVVITVHTALWGLMAMLCQIIKWVWLIAKHFKWTFAYSNWQPSPQTELCIWAFQTQRLKHCLQETGRHYWLLQLQTTEQQFCTCVVQPEMLHKESQRLSEDPSHFSSWSF